MCFSTSCALHCTYRCFHSQQCLRPVLCFVLDMWAFQILVSFVGCPVTNVITCFVWSVLRFIWSFGWLRLRILVLAVMYFCLRIIGSSPLIIPLVYPCFLFWHFLLDQLFLHILKLSLLHLLVDVHLTRLVQHLWRAAFLVLALLG